MKSQNRCRSRLCAIAFVSVIALARVQMASAQTLDNTEPLTQSGDLASEMIAGMDRFLLRQVAESPRRREAEWTHALKSPSASEFLSAKRIALEKQLGMVDRPLEADRFEVISQWERGTTDDTFLASSENAQAYRVRWPVFPGVDGTGILVIPTERNSIRFQCVLIPDASQSPEQLCGIGDDSEKVAFRLAEQGGLVLVPNVLSRTREKRNGRAVLSDQEYIYRSAFVLGRHVLGHQVNETLAAVGILRKRDKSVPILLAGWGEGGWIALHAGALSDHIDVTCVSGHFGPREQVWSEPMHRNVQSLLSHFGDAQLATLIAPRHLVIDPVPGPDVEIEGQGGAPGSLHGPTELAARSEFDLANKLLVHRFQTDRLHWVAQDQSSAKPVSTPSNAALQKSLQLMQIAGSNRDCQVRTNMTSDQILSRKAKDRQASIQKWDRHQQMLLEASPNERKWFWDSLKDANPGNYDEKIGPSRDRFRRETIGEWDNVLVPARPRTRRIYDTPTWTGYEVVLDVFDEIFAVGVLLLPKDSKPIANRPCVVFQHGLEGRPKDTIEGDHPAYHDVSVQLVNQGYVVFAPQNLYLFQDRFRTLQRKSNPLGKTLFSLMVPQHRQIARWLASRPEVDAKRIAFYGLSYGGKSAMRIPALVQEYCMSICSADFNEWVWKNASTTSPYSYVWTGEYEIFEFNLGRSFNYAEMAALIAPRPFMVERGHADGVAPDERVAFEFAKVYRHYDTVLKNPSACTIEWFDGPHTIHGKGTFEFLRKHLKYPVSE